MKIQTKLTDNTEDSTKYCQKYLNSFVKVSEINKIYFYLLVNNWFFNGKEADWVLVKRYLLCKNKDLCEEGNESCIQKFFKTTMKCARS